MASTLRGELLLAEFAQPPQQRLLSPNLETAASVPAVAVEPAAPLAASTSFAETASVEPANADTPNRGGRSTDASGTPIGEIRDRSSTPEFIEARRESEASEYSVPTGRLDDLDEAN